jgi:hypothetical protein
MGKSRQPDFFHLFRETFAGPPRKVRYEIRTGDSNMYHDVIFLSSLVHDARFRLADVRLKRGRLTIPLERDCWEIPLAEAEGRIEQRVARAELVIGPVVESEWTSDPLCDLEKPGHPGDDDEECLLYLWVERPSFDDSDTGRVILKCAYSRWTLTVAEEGMAIRLRDLEVPRPRPAQGDQST